MADGRENKKQDGLNLPDRPAGGYLSGLSSFAELLGTVELAARDAERLSRELDEQNAGIPGKPKLPDIPNIPEAALSSQTADKKEPEPTVEELLAELDGLVGLTEIKRDVRSLMNLVQMRRRRREAGLKPPDITLHMVFYGNPGTGKTTVARILGRLYRAAGVLPQGQLVETNRAGLVAGFVGQTAPKTAEVVQSAIGGVLFIDEAYSLTPENAQNDFGHEAVETLLTMMEDNRDRLVVIAAGYRGEMERFISSNPGLESRFARYFEFPDYTPEELFEILQTQCRSREYSLTDGAAQTLKTYFQELHLLRGRNFGNAREVRNLLERAVSAHADRLAAGTADGEKPGEEQARQELMLLTQADAQAAISE
ncbi:MAG: AAA family ATPase [Oscillospiraceae bacterium]|jgi:SpoVK/Ycf46/Vps4 family AAA+-type ATPase|nr:AAA family ATPase [Oscillospiraceae bacterium]